MKIRTRAFAALWLVIAMASIAIALAIAAFSIAGDMERERQRLTAVDQEHAALWRSLVELRHLELQRALTNTREPEQPDLHRREITDRFKNLETLLRAPDQIERFRQLRAGIDGSLGRRAQAAASGDPIADSSRDFEAVNVIMQDFEYVTSQ